MLQFSFAYKLYETSGFMKSRYIQSYLFSLYCFQRKKVCIYASNVLKENIFRNEVQWNKFEASIVFFILFAVLTHYFFYPFVLFLTQIIKSFQYFAQINCNFLSIKKDHSSTQSFTVSKIVINLPY